jgi:hypothetical protein
MGFTLTTLDRGFTIGERAAAAYGVPLWSGEWGWFGDPATVTPQIQRYLTRQNSDALGSAMWVWDQACGEPQSNPDDPSTGLINPVSCRTGDPLPSPPAVVTALQQAYPRSAPGRISSLTSSSAGVDLRLTGSGTGSLTVWAPPAATLDVTGTGTSGVSKVRQADGGWLVTAQANGDYTMVVRS